MIQNHKGGFDSASGMSKSAREYPIGAKNGKILGRPGQKIKKQIKTARFWALRAPFEPIYSASGVKKQARSHFRGRWASKPC